MEYEMSGKHGARWNSLDEFTQAYIECAFWTSEGPEDWQIGEDADFSDLAEEALAVLKADCEQFQRDYADALDRLNDGVPDRYAPYGADMAGHDLWLSRNGHGTGFFDRYMRGRDGLPYMPEAAAARLQEIARGLPSRDLYRGDDGLIYVS